MDIKIGHILHSKINRETIMNNLKKFINHLLEHPETSMIISIATISFPMLSGILSFTLRTTYPLLSNIFSILSLVSLWLVPLLNIIGIYAGYRASRLHGSTLSTDVGMMLNLFWLLLFIPFYCKIAYPFFILSHRS